MIFTFVFVGFVFYYLIHSEKLNFLSFTGSFIYVFIMWSIVFPVILSILSVLMYKIHCCWVSLLCGTFIVLSMKTCLLCFITSGLSSYPNHFSSFWKRTLSWSSEFDCYLNKTLRFTWENLTSSVLIHSIWRHELAQNLLKS